MAWFWVKMCPFEDALPPFILKKKYIYKETNTCGAQEDASMNSHPKTILRMKEHPVTHSVLHQAHLFGVEPSSINGNEYLSVETMVYI